MSLELEIDLTDEESILLGNAIVSGTLRVLSGKKERLEDSTEDSRLSTLFSIW